MKSPRFKPEYRATYAVMLSRIIACEISPFVTDIRKHDNVVFDVGANLGLWTKGWLDTFGDLTKEIHMFEPLAINIKGIQQRQNDGFFDDSGEELSGKLTILRTALGSDEGETTINYNLNDTGLSSIAHKTAPFSGRFVELPQSEKVPITTIDKYCDNTDIENIDFIKIDTEGYELNVLQGASRMLGERRVSRIAFEFGLHQTSQRHLFRDFWDILDSAGYSLSKLGMGRRGFGKWPIKNYLVSLEDFSSIDIIIAERK